MARTGCFFALCLACGICHGQDLAPRAYVITPIHTNAVILAYSYFNGSVLFDPTIPITNATSQTNVAILSLFHTFSFFGRSASLTAALPYGAGQFQGMVTGAPTEAKVYRSGLLDTTFRFAVNLRGGPAMPMNQYVNWRQKALLGASFTLVAPTGQYDPTRLINQGSNRGPSNPNSAIHIARAIGFSMAMEGSGFSPLILSSSPTTNSIRERMCSQKNP